MLPLVVELDKADEEESSAGAKVVLDKKEEEPVVLVVGEGVGEGEKEDVVKVFNVSDILAAVMLVKPNSRSI